MSIAEKKLWINKALIESSICCLPLAVFVAINFKQRDFALMFSSFVLLLTLFVGYILFKNHQVKCKSKS